MPPNSPRGVEQSVVVPGEVRLATEVHEREGARVLEVRDDALVLDGEQPRAVDAGVDGGPTRMRRRGVELGASRVKALTRIDRSPVPARSRASREVGGTRSAENALAEELE